MAGSFAWAGLVTPQDDPLPAEEVKEQLERILASSAFRSRQTAANILRLLVSEAQKGRTLKEKDIRAALFDPYISDTLVRTHISHLRSYLDEHYQGEGCDDPVLIFLPVRAKKKVKKTGREEAYPVVIRYNRNITYLKLGNGLLAQLAPTAIRRALRAFDLIITNTPDHVAATVGKVQCLCVTALYMPDPRPKSQIIEEAFLTASRLAEKHPDHGGSQIALGASLLCAGRLNLAETAFVAAHKLHPSKIMTSGWNPFSMLMMGRPDKAAEFASWIATRNPASAHAWGAYGLYLYFLRDFQQSEDILLMTVDLHRTSWITYIALTFLYLSTGQAKLALDTYMAANRVVPGGEIIMPGLGLLAAVRAKVDLPDYLMQNGRAIFDPARGRAENRDWLQIALYASGLDEEFAVRLLRLAFQCGDPLSVLFESCPVFDPLRERSDFRKLVEDIRLHVDYR